MSWYICHIYIFKLVPLTLFTAIQPVNMKMVLYTWMFLLFSMYFGFALFCGIYIYFFIFSTVFIACPLASPHQVVCLVLCPAGSCWAAQHTGATSGLSWLGGGPFLGRSHSMLGSRFGLSMAPASWAFDLCVRRRAGTRDLILPLRVGRNRMLPPRGCCHAVPRSRLYW